MPGADSDSTVQITRKFELAGFTVAAAPRMLGVQPVDSRRLFRNPRPACISHLPLADFMFDAAAMLGGIAMGGWGGSWGGGRGGGGGGRGGGRGSWGGWGGGGGGRGRHGGRANRPKGVGYGGGEGYGGRGEGKQAAKRKAEAARRQDEVDGAAADLLQQLRLRLDSWAGGLLVTMQGGTTSYCCAGLMCVASTVCACWTVLVASHAATLLLPCPIAHYLASHESCISILPAATAQARLAPLPLPLLGVLLGGPLAPLLRLLLHNDRQVAWRVSVWLCPF